MNADDNSSERRRRDKAETEQLVRLSLPGQEQARMIAGSLNNPQSGTYVVAVSYLEGSWYTSLLELYDPETLPAQPAADTESSSEVTRMRPRQFPGVPPVPEGIAVRLQSVHDNPVEAGADYGFIRSSLLQEGVEPHERLTGLQRLEHWIKKREQKVPLERLYSNPELAGDPEYRAELERQIQAIVPDPEEREALHSFYAFRYDIPR